MASALPVRLLPAAAQEQVEPPAGLPVGADMLVDPLPARHRDALLAEAAGDLLRAPALRKPVLHRAPPLRRHLPGNGRGGAAPRRGLALRLPVPVAAAAAVAPDLAPDRRPVPADLPGNGQVGQPAFPQRACPASFAIGQVVVAARHDSLHASTQGLSPPSGRFATSCAEGRRSPPLLVLHFRVARGRHCFRQQGDLFCLGDKSQGQRKPDSSEFLVIVASHFIPNWHLDCNALSSPQPTRLHPRLSISRRGRHLPGIGTALAARGNHASDIPVSRRHLPDGLQIVALATVSPTPGIEKTAAIDTSLAAHGREPGVSRDNLPANELVKCATAGAMTLRTGPSPNRRVAGPPRAIGDLRKTGTQRLP